MPKAQQFLDGALTAHPPPTLAIMREAFAQGWRLISDRYRDVEARARARLTLAGAIVAATPNEAASADDIARMAIDFINIVERDTKP
jgi:hypothetical protein